MSEIFTQDKNQITNFLDGGEILNLPSAQLMECALKNSKTAQTEFKRTSYVWEGYLIGEHTQSVIWFFDENFKTQQFSNAKISAIFRAIALCHDLGKYALKTVSYKVGLLSDIWEDDYLTDEEKEYEATETVADQFKKYDISPDFINEYVKLTKEISFDGIDVSQLKHRFEKHVCLVNTQKIFGELGFKNKDLAQFVVDFVFETQNLTTEYYVNNNETALEYLGKICGSLANKYGFDANPQTIYELMQMARALQTCDSGSYTQYAKVPKWTYDQADSKLPNFEKTIYNDGQNYRWGSGFVKTASGYRFKKDLQENQNTGEDNK